MNINGRKIQGISATRRKFFLCGRAFANNRCCFVVVWGNTIDCPSLTRGRTRAGAVATAGRCLTEQRGAHQSLDAFLRVFRRTMATATAATVRDTGQKREQQRDAFGHDGFGEQTRGG